MKNRIHSGLRVISFFTVIVFSWETVLWSAPAVPKPSALSLIHELNIPEAIGSIQERYLPPASSRAPGSDEPPMIIYVQDAHSHPEAQRNIEAILEYLTRQKKIQKIAVEAAFDRIDPKRLDFFSLPDVNLAVAQHLVSLGELTGAELFAMKQNGSSPELHGVEDFSLYQKSFLIFRQIKSRKNRVKTLADFYRLHLEQLESRTFHEDLAEFVRKRRAWEEKNDSSLDYFRVLRRLAKVYLKKDLGDPRHQFEWPNLTRLVKVTEVEAGLDSEAVRSQLRTLLAELKKKLPEGNEREFLVQGLQSFRQDPGQPTVTSRISANPYFPHIKTIRHFFEFLYRQTKDRGIPLLNYPQLLNFAGLLILHEEMDASSLLKEIQKLESLLERKLVRGGKERKTLLLSKDLLLMERLMSLGMTRDEYERYRLRKSSITFQNLAERFRNLDKAQVRYPVLPQGLMEQAEEFYLLSRQRDETLLGNTLKLIRPGPKATVLIAGGFHGAGLTELLREKQIPHLVVAPRMSLFEDGELYEKAMMGRNADLDGLLAEGAALAKAYLTYLIQHPEAYAQVGMKWEEERNLLIRALIEGAVPRLAEKGMTEEQIFLALQQVLEKDKDIFGPARFVVENGKYKVVLAAVKKEKPQVSRTSQSRNAWLVRSLSYGLLGLPGSGAAVRKAVSRTLEKIRKIREKERIEINLEKLGVPRAEVRSIALGGDLTNEQKNIVTSAIQLIAAASESIRNEATEGFRFVMDHPHRINLLVGGLKEILAANPAAARGSARDQDRFMFSMVNPETNQAETHAFIDENLLTSFPRLLAALSYLLGGAAFDHLSHWEEITKGTYSAEETELYARSYRRAISLLETTAQYLEEKMVQGPGAEEDKAELLDIARRIREEAIPAEQSRLKGWEGGQKPPFTDSDVNSALKSAGINSGSISTERFDDIVSKIKKAGQGGVARAEVRRQVPEQISRNYGEHRISVLSKEGSEKQASYTIEATEVNGQHKAILTVWHNSLEHVASRLGAALKGDSPETITEFLQDKTLWIHKRHFASSAAYDRDRFGSPVSYDSSEFIFQNSAGQIATFPSGFATAPVLRRFGPARPFSSFAEEKAFYEYRQRSDRTFGWKTIDGERTMRTALDILNRIPFLYSAGWSHSGAPDDHMKMLAWGGEGKKIDWRAATNGDHVETHARRQDAAYAVLRIDETHPQSGKFMEKILALGDTDFIDMEKDPSRKVLRVLVPDDLIQQNDRQAYQNWVKGKWNQIEEVAKVYLRAEEHEAGSRTNASQSSPDTARAEARRTEDKSAVQRAEVRTHGLNSVQFVVDKRTTLAGFIVQLLREEKIDPLIEANDLDFASFFRKQEWMRKSEGGSVDFRNRMEKIRDVWKFVTGGTINNSQKIIGNVRLNIGDRVEIFYQTPKRLSVVTGDASKLPVTYVYQGRRRRLNEIRPQILKPLGKKFHEIKITINVKETGRSLQVDPFDSADSGAVLVHDGDEIFVRPVHGVRKSPRAEVRGDRKQFENLTKGIIEHHLKGIRIIFGTENVEIIPEKGLFSDPDQFPNPERVHIHIKTDKREAVALLSNAVKRISTEDFGYSKKSIVREGGYFKLTLYRESRAEVRIAEEFGGEKKRSEIEGKINKVLQGVEQSTIGKNRSQIIDYLTQALDKAKNGIFEGIEGDLFQAFRLMVPEHENWRPTLKKVKTNLKNLHRQVQNLARRHKASRHQERDLTAVEINQTIDRELSLVPNLPSTPIWVVFEKKEGANKQSKNVMIHSFLIEDHKKVPQGVAILEALKKSGWVTETKHELSADATRLILTVIQFNQTVDNPRAEVRAVEPIDSANGVRLAEQVYAYRDEIIGVLKPILPTLAQGLSGIQEGSPDFEGVQKALRAAGYEGALHALRSGTVVIFMSFETLRQLPPHQRDLLLLTAAFYDTLNERNDAERRKVFALTQNLFQRLAQAVIPGYDVAQIIPTIQEALRLGFMVNIMEGAVEAAEFMKTGGQVINEIIDTWRNHYQEIRKRYEDYVSSTSVPVKKGLPSYEPDDEMLNYELARQGKDKYGIAYWPLHLQAYEDSQEEGNLLERASGFFKLDPERLEDLDKNPAYRQQRIRVKVKMSWLWRKHFEVVYRDALLDKGLGTEEVEKQIAAAVAAIYPATIWEEPTDEDIRAGAPRLETQEKKDEVGEFIANLRKAAEWLRNAEPADAQPPLAKTKIDPQAYADAFESLADELIRRIGQGEQISAEDTGFKDYAGLSHIGLGVVFAHAVSQIKPRSEARAKRKPEESSGSDKDLNHLKELLVVVYDNLLKTLDLAAPDMPPMPTKPTKRYWEESPVARYLLSEAPRIVKAFEKENKIPPLKIRILWTTIGLLKGVAKMSELSRDKRIQGDLWKRLGAEFKKIQPHLTRLKEIKEEVKNVNQLASLLGLKPELDFNLLIQSVNASVESLDEIDSVLRRAEVRSPKGAADAEGSPPNLLGRAEVRAGKLEDGSWKLEVKKEAEKDAGAIPKAKSMAEGDGSRESGLRLKPDISQRGGLRIDGTDEARRRFHSREYRGRGGAIPQKGIRPISLHRSRIPLRAPDTRPSRSRSKVSHRGTGPGTIRAFDRSRRHAERPPQVSSIGSPRPHPTSNFQHPSTSRRAEVRSDSEKLNHNLRGYLIGKIRRGSIKLIGNFEHDEAVLDNAIHTFLKEKGRDFNTEPAINATLRPHISELSKAIYDLIYYLDSTNVADSVLSAFFNIRAGRYRTAIGHLETALKDFEGLTTDPKHKKKRTRIIQALQTTVSSLKDLFPRAEVRAALIGKEEIAKALEDINARLKKPLFDEKEKERLSEKISSFNLEPEKEALVVGPGTSDYLSVLLAKLGLKPSIFDIDSNSLDRQAELHEKFGARDIQAFQSAEEIANRQFDYVFVLAAMNTIITDKMVLALWPHISDREIHTMMQSYLKDAAKAVLRPAVEHLKPEGGYLFTNNPTGFFKDLKTVGFQLDLYDLLVELGQEFGVQFKWQSGVALDDFSLHADYLKEKRKGWAYRASPLPRAEARRAEVRMDPERQKRALAIGVLEDLGQGRTRLNKQVIRETIEKIVAWGIRGKLGDDTERTVEALRNVAERHARFKERTQRAISQILTERISFPEVERILFVGIDQGKSQAFVEKFAEELFPELKGITTLTGGTDKVTDFVKFLNPHNSTFPQLILILRSFTQRTILEKVTLPNGEVRVRFIEPYVELIKVLNSEELKDQLSRSGIPAPGVIIVEDNAIYSSQELAHLVREELLSPRAEVRAFSQKKQTALLEEIEDGVVSVFSDYRSPLVRREVVDPNKNQKEETRSTLKIQRLMTGSASFEIIRIATLIDMATQSKISENQDIAAGPYAPTSYSVTGKNLVSRLSEAIDLHGLNIDSVEIGYDRTGQKTSDDKKNLTALLQQFFREELSRDHTHTTLQKKYDIIDYSESPTAEGRRVIRMELQRAEVRSDLAAVEAELKRGRPAEDWTSLATVIRTAEKPLGGIFDKLTAEILSRNLGILASRFSSLEKLLVPTAAAAVPAPHAFESISSRAEDIMQHSGTFGFNRMFGTNDQEVGKVGYVLGPEIFKRLGPAFAALQKAYGPQVRFALIAPVGDSEEASVYMKVVTEMNQKLPPDQQITVHQDPHAAVNVLMRKRFFNIRGIGIDRDALLFERIREAVPDFIPWTQSQVDTFVSGIPGLSSLLSEFTSEFNRALETAA